MEAVGGSLDFTDVVFRYNMAGLGGAVMITLSGTRFQNVVFQENIALRGAAISHWGNRLYSSFGYLQMENVTIQNNTVSNVQANGGIICIGNAKADLRKVSISKFSIDANVNDIVFFSQEVDASNYQESGLNLPLSPPSRTEPRRGRELLRLENEELLQQRSRRPVCIRDVISLKDQVNSCNNTWSGRSCIIMICSKRIQVPDESSSNSSTGIDLTNKRLVIICKQRKARCRLDGMGQSRIFYGSNASVTFHNIIFANGYHKKRGGAIMMKDDSNVTLWDCSFYNNTASFGSAISIDNTTLVVGGNRTTFINNNGNTPPLFIYSSKLELSEAVFSENKVMVEYDGAGILLFDSTIDLFNVTFSKGLSNQSYDCNVFAAVDSSDLLNSATCFNVL